MRRKNQNTDLKDDDKYELQGWNNDLDQLPGCSNLLKILQKKITFPLLQKQHKKNYKINKNAQNLPIIKQDQQKSPQNELKRKKKYSNLSPIMKTQKIEKPSTPNELKKQNSKPKKHRTEVSKLPINIEQQNNNNRVSKLLIFKQKNKSVNNFNRSYLKFFDSNRSPAQHDFSPQETKFMRMRSTKKQHNKAPSTQSLAIKTKIAELNLGQNHKQEQKADSKKMIRWDKFSISQDKLSQVYKKIESIRVIPKQGNQEKNETLSKIYDKNISQKKSSSVWLQRLMQKKQFQSKALKTQNKNFFLDDHLQYNAHLVKHNKNIII